MDSYTHMKIRQMDRYQIFVYDSVHSTNSLAMERLQTIDIPEFTVFMADQQTAGRGRQGKKWMAPKKSGVIMSIIIKPYLPLAITSQITLVAAIAVRRALANVSGISPDIKWPNDIFYGNRKICGILTEMNVQDKLATVGVVGIGVNLNLLPSDFPADLQKISTSLLAVTGQEWDRDLLADAILKEFAICYDQFIKQQSFAAFKKEWESHNYTIGKTVQLTYNQAPVKGTATGIDANGYLLVQLAHGEIIPVHSGEVQIVGS